jgi:hypothetical protein
MPYLSELARLAKRRGFKVCGFLGVGTPSGPRHFCDIDRFLKKLERTDFAALNHGNWVWYPQYFIVASRNGERAQIKFYYEHPDKSSPKYSRNSNETI